MKHGLNRWNVVRWWRVLMAEAFAEHAAGLRVLPTQPMQMPRHAVETLSGIFVRSCAEDVTMTDDGHIELALLPRDVVVFRDTAIVPGFDARGKAGWLMLCPSGEIFYTRARTVGRALDERAACDARWASCIARFGSVEHALARAQGVRWTAWCRLSDFKAAGMSAWSMDAALRRRYLRAIAYVLGGLPAFALHGFGALGTRVLVAREARALAEQARQHPASGAQTA